MKKKSALALVIGMLVAANIVGCGKNTEPIVNPGNEQENTEQNESDQTDAEQNGDEDEAESVSEKTYELKLPDYTFTRENFPKMDGSTSLVPLGKALAGNLLGEASDNVSALANFNRTTQSYRNLMNGDCDLLLASWPNETVFDEMKESHFDYLMEEISTEALIFVVNENNPVDNLTTQQIKDIYSGKITNWSEVGGNDEPIDAFQRNSGSGSQALMEKLIMQGEPMMEAPESYMIGGMGELMQAVKNYDNSATAIGYSVYYYANEMKMAQGLKIISVDGVEPNSDSIRKKEYPHTNAYYCVIAKSAKEDSPQRVIYDWLVGEEGQKLVAGEGYVSILDVGISDSKVSVVANRFTRLSDEWIEDFKADASLGAVYPFCGETLFTGDDEGYSYMAGNKYGLVDASGRIVTDPVYSNYSQLTYYDGATEKLPYWIVEKICGDTLDDSQTKYGLIAMDGSFATECKYDSIIAGGDGILLREKYGEKKFEIINFEGKVIATEQDFGEFSKDFSLELSDGEGIVSLFDGKNTYSYMDLKGKKLSGPYDYATAFFNERGVVQKGEWYGIVNQEGNYVLNLAYDWANVENDVFLRSSLGETEYVFDYDGNELAVTDNSHYIYFDTMGNYGILPGDDTKEEVTFCNSENKPVYRIMANQDIQVGNTTTFYRQEGKYLILENKITKEKTTIEGYEGVNDLYSTGLSSGGYTGDFTGRGYMVAFEYTDDSTTEMLLNSKLESLITVKGYITCIEDAVSGELYFSIYDEEDGQFHIYTEELTEILKTPIMPLIHNKHIFLFDDYTSTILDMDKKVLFSYAQKGNYGD